MTKPIALLRDDFANNTIDPPWSKTTTGSATGAETGGQAVLTLPSSTAGSHDARYTSVAADYDLTGDSASISIGTMVATGVAATAYFRLVLDANNYYEWTQTSGTLKARKVVNAVPTDLFSAAWSSSTHKYLRIRESGGTVFFDSSTSASAGASWTNRGSTTIASAFAVTALQIVFGASCGNVASPGSFRLDDYNAVLPAPSATWRETTADWQISNRLRPITLASDGGMLGVIVTADSMDASRVLGGTVRYFAGPLGSASGGYLALTEYASLAAAQASAFPIPVDGRVDLPALIDARYIRLYHRSVDGVAHALREFVPRRIVQADDIEAESISAINIAAHTITADQIAVINLDATAYITAGGGVVTLDNDGISITSPIALTVSDVYGYTFQSAALTTYSGIYGYDNPGVGHGIEMLSHSIAGENAFSVIESDAPTGKFATVLLNATAGVKVASIDLTSDGGTSTITADAEAIKLTNLNVGSGVTGAANGQIKASGFLTPSGASSNYGGNTLALANNATAAIGTTNFGFVFVHAGGFAALYALNGSLHTTTEISDPSGVYTPTVGSLSSLNIYWSAANSRYEIENKRGSSQNVRIWILEAA